MMEGQIHVRLLLPQGESGLDSRTTWNILYVGKYVCIADRQEHQKRRADTEVEKIDDGGEGILLLLLN